MKQRTRNTWAAGRAPACWQDAVAQQTTRVKNLRRICTWVEPPPDALPKLRQGPLLGNCLEVLTNTAVTTDESQPIKQPRPGVARPIEPVDRARRFDRSAEAVPKRSTGTQAAKPDELARSIDRARLSHWAGADTRGHSGQTTGAHLPSEPAIRSSMSSAETPEGAAVKHGSPPFGSTPGVSGRRQGPINTGAPPAEVSIEAQHVWLERLAQRALRTQPMATKPHAVAALVAQWTGQLGGQTISLDLLAEWIQVQPRLRQAEQGRSPANRNAVTPLDRAPGATAPVSVGQTTGREASSGMTTDRSTTTQVYADAAESEPARPIHIAPPAIAQALPQLLPAQTRHDVSPEAAANLAQRGAEHEALEGNVDLAQLAANVKRILDEEARRYGIDI